MSQRLQFYKLIIFSEGITEGFSSESIYSSLKALFAGSEPYAEEMIKKYFEALLLPYVNVSASEFKGVLPEFNKKLEYVFSNKVAAFSMVDNEVWCALQKVVNTKIKEELKAESKLTERLERICQVTKDYALLSELFEAKLLFVNFF